MAIDDATLSPAGSVSLVDTTHTVDGYVLDQGSVVHLVVRNGRWVFVHGQTIMAPCAIIKGPVMPGEVRGATACDRPRDH
jgi:hypothetical protein